MRQLVVWRHSMRAQRKLKSAWRCFTCTTQSQSRTTRHSKHKGRSKHSRGLGWTASATVSDGDTWRVAATPMLTMHFRVRSVPIELFALTQDASEEVADQTALQRPTLRILWDSSTHGMTGKCGYRTTSAAAHPRVYINALGTSRELHRLGTSTVANAQCRCLQCSPS